VGVWRVDNLHVICFVPAHELVTSDSIQHGMHDWPFRIGGGPTKFRFLLRQVDCASAADVEVELTTFDE